MITVAASMPIKAITAPAAAPFPARATCAPIAPLDPSVPVALDPPDVRVAEPEPEPEPLDAELVAETFSFHHEAAEA